MAKGFVLPHDATTKKFLLAGKCYVTLERVLDGQRYTYKVEQKCEEETVKKDRINDLRVKYTVEIIQGTEADLDAGHGVRVRVRHPFWFVSLVNGAIGDVKPKYLGVIDDKGFRTTKGTRRNKNASAENINLFGDTLAWLNAGTPHEHRVRVWHTGRCGRCAKELSVPESIATGLGPVCAKAMGVKLEDVSPSLIEKIAALEGE